MFICLVCKCFHRLKPVCSWGRILAGLASITVMYVFNGHHGGCRCFCSPVRLFEETERHLANSLVVSTQGTNNGNLRLTGRVITPANTPFCFKSDVSSRGTLLRPHNVQLKLTVLPLVTDRRITQGLSVILVYSRGLRAWSFQFFLWHVSCMSAMVGTWSKGTRAHHIGVEKLTPLTLKPGFIFNDLRSLWNKCSNQKGDNELPSAT